MKNLALLLFAATVGAAAAPPPRGTLCVAKDCRSVDGTAIDVAPADVAKVRVDRSTDEVYEVWRVVLPPGSTEARLTNWVPLTTPARAGVSAGKTVLEVVPVPLP